MCSFLDMTKIRWHSGFFSLFRREKDVFFEILPELFYSQYRTAADGFLARNELKPWHIFGNRPIWQKEGVTLGECPFVWMFEFFLQHSELAKDLKNSHSIFAYPFFGSFHNWIDFFTWTELGWPGNGHWWAGCLSSLALYLVVPFISYNKFFYFHGRSELPSIPRLYWDSEQNRSKLLICFTSRIP